jgi:hypothetical protein
VLYSLVGIVLLGDGTDSGTTASDIEFETSANDDITDALHDFLSLIVVDIHSRYFAFCVVFCLVFLRYVLFCFAVQVAPFILYRFNT